MHLFAVLSFILWSPKKRLKFFVTIWYLEFVCEKENSLPFQIEMKHLI